MLPLESELKQYAMIYPLKHLCEQMLFSECSGCNGEAQGSQDTHTCDWPEGNQAAIGHTIDSVEILDGALEYFVSRVVAVLKPVMCKPGIPQPEPELRSIASARVLHGDLGIPEQIYSMFDNLTKIEMAQAPGEIDLINVV